MDFGNNYDSFQGQPTGEQPGMQGGAGAPPQQSEMGQPMDNGAGGFAAGGMGAPTGNGQEQQGGDAKTTLWMGELEPWIDENFVRSIWYNMGEQVNVKMIRDKFSG
jgi:hypothetical protein